MAIFPKTDLKSTNWVCWANENVEIKKWGTVPEFDFTVRDHIDLAKSLDLIDFDRGTKVGGSRAYFLKNEAAQMEFAVLFYTFQKPY